jgi:hypothetical protein
MRVGAREMTYDDAIGFIVPEHGRQMCGLEPRRACRYQRGERPGAHQRTHLRQIVRAKMVGLVLDNHPAPEAVQGNRTAGRGQGTPAGAEGAGDGE